MTKYMSIYNGKPVEVYKWAGGIEVKDPHSKRPILYRAEELEDIIENMER